MRIRPLTLLIAAGAAVAVPALWGAAGGTSTIAGTQDLDGASGDGGPAAAALLSYPVGVAIAPDGRILIADQDNHRIRAIAPDGTITAVAGTGLPGGAGDGGPAALAQLDTPAAVASLPDGGFLVAETVGSRVRRVAADGTITTVAGTGLFGDAGDGGWATRADLDRPAGVAVEPGGAFLVADTFNNRVRRVGADGRIRTIAGNGTPGDGGDGGPATEAELNLPTGVAVTSGGAILVADQGNHRIRRIDADGMITTVAGTTAGFSGDGGPATSAELSAPSGVAPLPDGGFLVADQDNNRVRAVDAGGIISTVGDTETAAGLVLSLPASVAPLAGGDVLVADAGSHRVMRISATPAGATAPAPHAVEPVQLTVLRAWRTGRTVRVRVRVNQVTRVTLWVRPAAGAGRAVAVRDARPGVVTLSWSGRLAGRVVRPGRYRMVVAAGVTGQRVTSRVRVAP